MTRTLTCTHGHFFSPWPSCQVLQRQRRTQKRVATGILTVVMNATPPSFALPHDPLTKITDKPSFASVMHLCKELCENAMSACSAQGGQCGHLKHNAMPGAQPWVDPQNPGAPQVPASAAACQMAMLTGACNCSTKEHNTWLELSAKLKKLILSSADNTCLDELANHLTGHAAVASLSQLWFVAIWSMQRPCKRVG
jgi:hypothetical protein